MDEHERTRAILWSLCDSRPDMPLAEALGYLKAVEAQLEREERERASVQDALTAGRPPTGDAAVAQLVRDLAGNRVIKALARRGDVSGIAETLVKHAGASPAVAGQAAKTLANVAATEDFRSPWT